MSMTREEAIDVLRRLPVGLLDMTNEQKWDLTEAIDLALTSLLAPTREQVEKMRGEWERGEYACGEHEWECSKCHETEWRSTCSRLKFCPFCGAPMTDEAVDIMLERLRKMNEE